MNMGLQPRPSDQRLFISRTPFLWLVLEYMVKYLPIGADIRKLWSISLDKDVKTLYKWLALSPKIYKKGYCILTKWYFP